jgi:hypothetical protein
LGFALGQENVVRFDVAMHHALPMGIRQRASHLGQDAHRLGYRQLAFPRDPRAEGLALHVGHRVVEEVFHSTGGEKRDDVRVLQARRHLDLAAESLRGHPESELGG